MTIYTHDEMEMLLIELIKRTLSEAKANDPDDSPGSYHDKLHALAAQQNGGQRGTPVHHK